MHKLLLGFFFLTSSFFTQAALPPFYQSQREIKAVLDHPVVAEKFSGGPGVSKIERTSEGYVVTSGKCELTLKMKYLPATLPGPAKFELTAGDYICE